MNEQVRRKPVKTVYIYKEKNGLIKYKGYDEDWNIVANPKASFPNRMFAAETLRERYPKARVVFTSPKQARENIL